MFRCPFGGKQKPTAKKATQKQPSRRFGSSPSTKNAKSSSQPPQLPAHLLTKRTPDAAAEPAKATISKHKAPAAAAVTRFEILLSRKSSVVDWDEATFDDCRPSEADDSMDEHVVEATRRDHTGIPLGTTGPTSRYFPKSGPLCAQISEGFGNGCRFAQMVTKDGQALRTPSCPFTLILESGVENANAMAKAVLALAVADMKKCTECRSATSEWGCNVGCIADEDIMAEHSKPIKEKPSPLNRGGAAGAKTYTAVVPSFCDVYGTGVENIAESVISAAVVLVSWHD
jgi:hypothetical protein